MISFNFRLIYGLTVLQQGLKIGPSDCIQMSETSDLPGAPPPDPRQEHCPWTPPGALRRTPGPHADLLRLLHSLRSNFFSTPLQKTFRGPWLWCHVYLKVGWRLVSVQSGQNASLEKGFKGSQLCAFCPYARVYCYIEFKRCYLKKMKLFLIRVKDLSL